ncbi:MAG: rod shape-determining protein MreC [Fibrobacter sp.]|jgi:rod shape-determining protein MreC|nr:rod shape-determining protein MreC [Fibrobacter sp.]
MKRIFRAVISVLSWKQGIFFFILLLTLGIVMRSMPLAVQEGIVAGALRTVYFPAQWLVSSVDNYIGLYKENDQLRLENARLRVENDLRRESLAELERLYELVRFDNKWDYPIVTARVVGKNPGRFVTTMVVDRGSNHGVRAEMPVFTVDGLIGKTARVAPFYSQVQLLTDPNLKMSMIATRTRVVGFLESSNGSDLFAMIPTYAEVRVGDTLSSSGLGGVFPKGLGVGVISSVQKGDVDVMQQIKIDPFVNFARIEELFIMLKEPDWNVREMLE